MVIGIRNDGAGMIIEGLQPTLNNSMYVKDFKVLRQFVHSTIPPFTVALKETVLS